MASNVKTEIYIDLPEYAKHLADKVAQLANVDVRIRAKQKVRRRSYRLLNSIRTEKLGFCSYQTVAETPYAAAQEYGRPDLPRYGFTPFMRPAAQEVGSQENIQKYLKQAEESAKMAAKK